MFLDDEEEALHYEQFEYENKPHNVQCRSCGWIDEGSQMDLELKGWALSAKGEFCPKCANSLLELSEAIAA
jgi:Zn finger protein HypA/HybF involved in hydrogenase expression